MGLSLLVITHWVTTTNFIYIYIEFQGLGFTLARKYWLVSKDQLSFVWPILISKVRKVTKGLINYEGENEETNEMEWFSDYFRIETQAGQDKELGIIFLLFYERENSRFSLSDKMTWLSKQIFSTFPKDVPGLKFYVLDCGCIYYQRVFRDGEPDTQVGIYRDADCGPCEVCILQEDNWMGRVIDETVIYNSQFQIEPSNFEP